MVFVCFLAYGNFETNSVLPQIMYHYQPIGNDTTGTLPLQRQRTSFSDIKPDTFSFLQ